MTQSTENLYANLSQLFIELRGRGISLSGTDLETLRQWKIHNIEPEFIAKIMCEMANECLEESISFPSGLAPIARRVKRELSKGI